MAAWLWDDDDDDDDDSNSAQTLSHKLLAYLARRMWRLCHILIT
jgi:hypothetical protein